MTEEFQHLQEITGQKVNPSKTEILCVGQEMRQALLSTKYAPHVKNTVKILGVYFGQNNANMTWDERLSKVQAVTNAYKARRLTWFGRINILHSLAMSQVIYHARVVNIRKDVAKKFSTVMHRFLWFPEVIEGIRRTRLHAPKTEGGIGMFSIQCKLDACRAEKFRRLASLGKKDLSNIWE